MYQYLEDGFTTTKGRFLSRQAALILARKARQVNPQMRPDDDWMQVSSDGEMVKDDSLRAEELLDEAERKHAYISVSGMSPMKVLLSKNTIAGEKPYRATWFLKSGEPAGHTDLSEAEYLDACNGLEVVLSDGKFHAVLRPMFESLDEWRKELNLSTNLTTDKGLAIEVRLKQNAPSSDGWIGGRMQAFIDNTRIGFMTYGGEAGDPPNIGETEVVPRYRRKGVASAMFRFARANGIPLKHYPEPAHMSLAGRAFASAVTESFLSLFDLS